MKFETDKNGLALLYDTVDKKEWKGWLSTAQEIMQHPQQNAPEGPRFIHMEEYRRRLEAEDMAARVETIKAKKPKEKE